MPPRGFWFSPSLILSKLTYNYYGHKNEVRKTRILFAAKKKKKKHFQRKNDEIKVLFTFYDIQKLGGALFKSLKKKEAIISLPITSWIGSCWSDWSPHGTVSLIRKPFS